MSADRIELWARALAELVDVGAGMAQAIEHDDVLGAIAAGLEARRIRGRLAWIAPAAPEHAAELAAMADARALIAQARGAEQILERWAARPLPPDQELVKSPLGAAVLAEAMLPASWDFDADLVVLIGDGLDGVGEVLSALGQRRIMVIEPEGAPVAVAPAWAAIARTDDEIARAVRTMDPLPPQRVAVRALGDDAPARATAIAEVVRTTLSDLRVHRNTPSALGRETLEALYGNVARLLQHHHHRQAAVGQARDFDSLHGHIAVGFLIVQDLAVVVAMMLMSALRDTGASDGVVLEVALSLAARLATCALLLFVLMRWVLPVVLAAMARSQELLLLFAIAWGVALAALGELAGFSKEGRRLPGRLLTGLVTVPGGDERPADRHPGLPAALLLHRPGRTAGAVDPGRGTGAGDGAVSVRADRQSADRDGHHGLDGLPQAHRLPGRAHGGADQRVLDRLRRDGHLARPCGHAGARPDHAGGPADDHAVDLHDPVFASAVRAPGPWLGLFEQGIAGARGDGSRAGKAQPTQGPRPTWSSSAWAATAAACWSSCGRNASRSIGVDLSTSRWSVRLQALAAWPAHFGDGEDADFLDSLPLRQAGWLITTLPQWDRQPGPAACTARCSATPAMSLRCARDALHAHALQAKPRCIESSIPSMTRPTMAARQLVA